MITRHERGRITWVDLESPSRDELSHVMQEFGIDPQVEEEIATATPYPLSIASSRYLYLVLHFPTTDPNGGTKSQEIDFIVGKHFLITARYEIIKTIHNLHKVFEAEELLGLHGNIQTADALLERIMRRLYTAIREEIEEMSVVLDKIERDIFGGKEKATVRAISETNRVLLRFDTILKRHAESLPIFLNDLCATQFFGKKFASRTQRIQAEHDHVAALVSSYREVAGVLQETNNSLLSASQNSVMKDLTVIASITLPLGLITDLFQMNVADAPFANDPHAFWIILIIILSVSVGLILYSKKRKWL